MPTTAKQCWRCLCFVCRSTKPRQPLLSQEILPQTLHAAGRTALRSYSAKSAREEEQDGDNGRSLFRYLRSRRAIRREDAYIRIMDKVRQIQNGLNQAIRQATKPREREPTAVPESSERLTRAQSRSRGLINDEGQSQDDKRRAGIEPKSENKGRVRFLLSKSIANKLLIPEQEI